MEVGTRKKTYIWTKTGWVAVPVKVLYLIWEPVGVVESSMNEINGNYYGRSAFLKTGLIWAETTWV